MNHSKPEYFYCEECNTPHKKRKNLIFFKGKSLCHFCKLKASIQAPVLSLNISDAVLEDKVPLKEIGIDYRRLEKKKHSKLKGFLKVPETLKVWADNRERRKLEGANKVIWVGLNKDEHKVLFNHFAKEGLSDEQIDIEIKKIEDTIRENHNKFKQGIKLNKPTFQEEFSKLVAR